MIDGTPSRSQDAMHVEAIASAIGHVVLHWGVAEQSLDLAVAMLWHSFNGRRHAKKLPFMLKNKIEFIRSCVSQTPHLATLNDEAAALMAEVERLGKVRHDVVHGAIASISPVNGSILLSKLDVKDNFHHSRSVEIPMHSYPDLIMDLANLGTRCVRFAEAINRLTGE